MNWRLCAMRFGVSGSSVVRVLVGVSLGMAGFGAWGVWGLTHLEGVAPVVVLTPSERHVRALAQARLRFRPFVFTGERFPKCEYTSPESLRVTAGPYSIRTQFYDVDGYPVSTADRPGPYQALVVVTPSSGRILRRLFTVYRLYDFPDTNEAPETVLERLIDYADLPRSMTDRDRELLLGSIRARPFRQTDQNLHLARVLAGVHLRAREDSSADRLPSALDLERRWWVRWKLDFYGLNLSGRSKFSGPSRLEGSPATELREGTPGEAGFTPAGLERIDQACRDWAENGQQAMGVCIARHGVVALHSAYGQRDGKPMTVETKSRIASITKPMSASLMMMLVDQGLVNLDDPVEQALPWLWVHHGPKPLTIRHLYTHTHGLERWLLPIDELSDYEERVGTYYPFLRVGKTWSYNGSGYVLGGKIVEAMTHEAMPDAYRRFLLGPLGCQNTDVSGTHADARSIPLDVAKLGQMLLNRGAYGPWRFFSEETFEKMLPRPLGDLVESPKDKLVGIGLFGDAEQFGHTSATGSVFQIRPKHELVVVVTRNGRGKDYDRQLESLWNAIDAAIADDAQPAGSAKAR